MTTTRALSHAAFVGYACLLAWLSLREPDGMPPGQWDKAAHLLAYAVFAGLGALLAADRRALCLIGAGIVAYGGLLELAQAFAPGRFPSVLDLLANALGVLLGGTLAAWWIGIGPRFPRVAGSPRQGLREALRSRPRG